MEKLIYALLTLVYLGVGSWLVKGQKKNSITQSLRLFPYLFKIIGYIWVGISLIMVVVWGLKSLEVWQIIAHHNLNLGLFLLCFARDKREDELSNLVRLRAFYYSVVSGFVVVILFNFLNLVLGDDELSYPSRALITIILAVYAFSYSTLKRKVFYGK
ncbi:MAG TPA: hypothetical protein VEP89_01680 [Draconibacterium sp.]|nr:hypothetical protein [Draconibacterium sp.]